MTPEEHQMLADTKALSEENSKILQSIQKMNRVSLAMKAVYWVIVIGITFGAFYLIQPYIDAIKGATGDGQTSNSQTDLNELLRGL